MRVRIVARALMSVIMSVRLSAGISAAPTEVSCR